MPDLQIGATATGNGTAFTVLRSGTVSFQLSGTFVATVAFESTVDGTNWVALTATNQATTTAATTATTPGIYTATCAALARVRARISAYTSGSVFVFGESAPGGGSGGGGAGGGGAVTVADGADVTLGAKADAKSTATDTTPVSEMSVLKQISSSVQALVTSMIAALGPGEEHIGSVGSNTSSIYFAPTIAASAHAANDVIGGKITLTNYSRVAGLGSRALSMSLRWLDTTPPAVLDFLFFRTDPSTNIADDAAWSWGTSNVDAGTPFGFHVRVVAAEWTASVGTGGTIWLCTKLLGVAFVPTTADAKLYIVTPNALTTVANTLNGSIGPDRD